MLFKLTKTTVAIMTGVALTLTACSDNKSKQPKKTVITVKAQMDAEELALGAEQLVGPFTFMMADKIIKMALEKDPENTRAKFYKHFLKPFMVTKGLASRVIPLVKKEGDYARYQQEMDAFPRSEFKTFMLSGKKDIKTVADAQIFFIEYRKAWNEFRVFLRENPQMDLTLNLNPHIWEQHLRDRTSDLCQIFSKSPEIDTSMEIPEEYAMNHSTSDYEVVCDFQSLAQVKINSSDIAALQQSAAGMVLGLTYYTSYNIKGIDKLLEVQRRNAGVKIGPEETQRILEETPEFGTLLEDESISQVISLGSDFKAAWNWALTHHQSLCPQGVSHKSNRKGHLFENGICAERGSEARSSLRILGQILNGSIITELTTDGGSQQISTEVDVLAWSRKPVEDLRTLAPKTYGQCGEATSFRDKTFGGIFPEGNAEIFLTAPKQFPECL